MVGILIIAHASYGEALVRSISHVLGHPPARVMHLGMTVREDPDVVLARVFAVCSCLVRHRVPEQGEHRYRGRISRF